MRRFSVSLLCLSFWLTAPAFAQEALGPVPEPVLRWASVETPYRSVYQEPTTRSTRIGLLRRGRSFPIYATQEGPRCKAPWHRIGARGWICGESLLDAQGPPEADPGPALPFSYVITYKDTSIYHRPDKKARTGRRRKAKSTLTVVERQEDWVKTFPDDWYRKRVLLDRQLREYRLEGEVISAETPLPLAFARVRGVKIYPEPGLKRHQRKKLIKEGLPELRRFDRRPVLEQYPPNARYGGTWLRLEEGWVRRQQVALVKTQERPRGVKEGEQWIVIDLSEQTAVAYEGDQMVYATLVSTGKGKAGEESKTPLGRWRITHKLRSTRMAGGDGPTYHYLSDVPWVQYFFRGYAIHGVYWHNSFGWVQSQGCINMVPKDAQWFFLWTQPTLPQGWYTYIPNEEDKATWVVVQK